MIVGKTNTGFAFKVPKRTFHSMKINRMMTGITQESTAKEVFDFAYALLGTDQCNALMDHCDEVATDERFGDEIFSEELGEVVTACQDDSDVKNS